MSSDKQKKTKRKKPSRTVEKTIFQKYKGKCAICGTKAPFDYGELDHIKPLAKGGSPTALSNYQWLCSRCNKLKGGSRTNAEVKKILGIKKTKKKTTRKKKKSDDSSIFKPPVFKPPKFKI